MTSTIAAALAAALFAAAPAAPAAAPGDAQLLQQLRDRAQIEQLMWDYNRALDGFHEDAYAAVFTPDGAFGKTRGRAALRQMILDLKKGRAEREAGGEPQPGMYHVETNEHVEFTGRDHARVHYYWMTVFGGAPDPKAPPRVAAVGHGVDELVRVGGRWLIQDRNVSPADD